MESEKDGEILKVRQKGHMALAENNLNKEKTENKGMSVKWFINQINQSSNKYKKCIKKNMF